MKFASMIIGLSLASTLALASANAADMYRPPEGVSYKDAPAPMALWTGPYVGIDGGYAWGRDSVAGIEGLRLLAPPAPVSFASNGGFGGGQIGYNWQHDHLVVGVEADIQGADIAGSGTLKSATADNKLDWFGTVRGRLGYSIGAALLYGTGGLAFGGVQDKLTFGGKTNTHNATATGYAAGGGLEYAFNPAWSAKAEYQYINLGGDTLTAADQLQTTVTAKFEHEYNTVRLGLNYHIHPGYEPLK
jgi:outer membrane immunogenic protein